MAAYENNGINGEMAASASMAKAAQQSRKWQ